MQGKHLNSLLKVILDAHLQGNGLFFHLMDEVVDFLEEQPDFFEKKFFRALKSFEILTYCSDEYLEDQLLTKKKSQFLLIIDSVGQTFPPGTFNAINMTFLLKHKKSCFKITRAVVGKVECYYEKNGEEWKKIKKSQAPKLMEAFADFITAKLFECEEFEFNFKKQK